MKKIVIYGSSLLSAYWNGAATYYRGILKALHQHGYEITFFEPDAFDRGSHRDMEEPDWARVIIYLATEEGLRSALAAARDADFTIKASGVGVFDDEILEGLLANAPESAVKAFWDVDAPATLAALGEGTQPRLARALDQMDLILTYGGGARVVEGYRKWTTAPCVPIYNALDPQTHHPVACEERYSVDLSFLGNRLPDREARVEEFFFKPARLLPGHRFLLGGAGWEPSRLPGNVHYVGHVGSGSHNAFNASPRAVINISRDAMAATGFSPATRVFEAAGAGACLITDEWEGLRHFLEPGAEVLVARSGMEVAEILRNLTPTRAKALGKAAREKVLCEHTYQIRAAEVAEQLARAQAKKRTGALV